MPIVQSLTNFFEVFIGYQQTSTFPVRKLREKVILYHRSFADLELECLFRIHHSLLYRSLCFKWMGELLFLLFGKQSFLEHDHCFDERLRPPKVIQLYIAYHRIKPYYLLNGWDPGKRPSLSITL